MNSVLIADSGSTKTDWTLCRRHGKAKEEGAADTNDDRLLRFQTRGINPVLMSLGDIQALIDEELKPCLNAEPIAELHFYGAGCRAEQLPKMRKAFASVFSETCEMNFYSDMLAAARALCGRHEGIACILGTGANSCLYDGHAMVQNTSPLGYILGDEGSGAVLGRRFLNLLYEGQLPSGLRDAFEQSTGLTLPLIINKVYREPMPNRFLASLSPFVHAHLDILELHALVVDGFRQFIARSIRPYGRADLPLNVVGSIGFYYAPQFEKAARHEGFRMGKVLKSPMEGLISYHQ